MSIDEAAKAAKETVGVVADLIKAAGENEYAKEAGNNLGKSAVILTGAINTLLLPLEGFAYLGVRARKYFENSFKDDFNEAVEGIPADQIVEPKAAVVVPAMQGLALSHEDQNLKDMYLRLLAASVDARFTSTVHPGFAEVIRQLTSLEAQLLQRVLVEESYELRGSNHAGRRGAGTEKVWLARRFTRDDIEVDRVMVDNWVRLGLMERSLSRDNYALSDIERAQYSSRNDYDQSSFARAIVRAISDQTSNLLRTEFGKRFAQVVGILSEKSQKEDG